MMTGVQVVALLAAGGLLGQGLYTSQQARQQTVLLERLVSRPQPAIPVTPSNAETERLLRDLLTVQQQTRAAEEGRLAIEQARWNQEQARQAAATAAWNSRQATANQIINSNPYHGK
jgi:hypothetical protein